MDYIVLPSKRVNNDLMAAYLSSSLFPLSLETNANLSLGVGYLTLGTLALRRLLTIDLRGLSKSKHLCQILEAADKLYDLDPLHAAQYPNTPEMKALDEAFLRALSLKGSRARELEEQVAHFAAVRIRLQKLKQASAKEASRHDVGAVAESIGKKLEEWLSARRFPEDYVEGGKASLEFPSDVDLHVHTEPFFERCRILVQDPLGSTLLDHEYSLPVATVILRALQFGRRKFNIPNDDGEARAAIKTLSGLVVVFEELFEQALAETGIGTKYANQIESRVLRAVGVRLGELKIDIKSREWIIPAQA